MLDKLDVKQMRLLLLLEEKENISRVADTLNVSQQAVSVQLKALRAIFHDQLFVRHGHKMVPTPKCGRLCLKLKGIIESLEIDAQPETFDPKRLQQQIIISATDYAQQSALVKIFANLREEAPGLKLIAKNIEIDTLEASLREGKVDLAISIPDFLPEQLPYKMLFREEYQCVANVDAAITINHFTDLNHFDHVIISPSRANLKGSSEQWFKDQGLNRNIVASIPSFNLLSSYLKNTTALAFIPSRLLPTPDLKTIALDRAPPGFDLVVAWHPKTSHSPLHRWLIEKLVESIKE